MSPKNNNKQVYLKLEQRLVLLAWLNDLFGYKRNRDLLADMKDRDEGFDALGHSKFYHVLEANENKLKVPLEKITRYDENIRLHLTSVNSRRSNKITLRYFQYLALLYTELFLDWYFNHRGKLIQSLNEFVLTRNASKSAGESKDSKFEESDLKKLAYWMATGSGKTLIMHINYLQFLKYNNLPLDNILLITPNEGLSEQHMEEMRASNIRCKRFDLNESGQGLVDRDSVKVIEITKLVEEKRGGGISVPVESFEGNNLIFVDEGHKGSGGEAWRKFRDAIGKTGFTFEYSATFGQALTAAKKDDLTAEYGKAIIFDYSYRYFHGDGYGKDFNILNLREETTEDKTDILLLGNLLSFYEQLRIFEEEHDNLKPYNLERPLWVFVGSTVNAVYTEQKQKRSDVLTVVRFLHRLLENKRGWVIGSIKKLINGKTGLVSPEGHDIFEEKFGYLRKTQLTPEDIYMDILLNVLGTPAGGALHLCDLRGHEGEIGLKASGSEDYFGLVYIGDTSSFKKLVEEDDSGVVLEEDVVGSSLFENINEPDTSINILIGAKKFMEGWNSWRVSNMGLLNIGRKEGSEIIQLFGRGVRLKGKDLTLKRSSKLPDNGHPENIGLLETLNIFAVRANYMSQFREYLEREGLDTEGQVHLPLNIKPNKDFLKEGLLIPRVQKSREFTRDVGLLLEPDESIKIKVDMSLKVQSLESRDTGLKDGVARSGKDRVIDKYLLTLIDWQKTYIDLIEYKESKGMANLAIRPETPKEIMEFSNPNRLYTLIADDKIFSPNSFGDTLQLQEAVLTILKKYSDRFYANRLQKWETDNMDYTGLDSSDDNFQDYNIRIPKSKTDLIEEITKLIDEANDIYQKDLLKLPTLHFSRHLYQPLLVKDSNGVIESTPPGLEPSEKRFVEDLREYWNADWKKEHKGQDVYLLRNLERGAGVGFYGEGGEGFYPDFILWIKEKDSQRIIFIEPHGMIFAKRYDFDDKARLHERLPELSKAMCKRAKKKDIYLDSFIISATKFDDLKKRYEKWSLQEYADHHILFPDKHPDLDYIKLILRSCKE